MLSTRKNFRDLHICRCACPINTCASSFNTVHNTHAYKSLPTHRLRNRVNLNKWTQNGTWILLNILKKTIQHYLTPDNLKILVFSFQMEATSPGRKWLMLLYYLKVLPMMTMIVLCTCDYFIPYFL